MLKEVCLAQEQFDLIPVYLAKGAARFELNANLELGGTTPNNRFVRSAAKLLNGLGELTCMVRPRGGDFVYNTTEINQMDMTISQFGNISGVTGIAIGVLTPSNYLDKDNMERLIKKANESGLDVTMHMAFDELSQPNQLDAIDWLSEHGVKRILTHGGKLTTPISDTLPSIRKLIDYAGNRIKIMPGGGIRNDNLAYIVQTIHPIHPICVHGTKIITL